MSEPKMAFVSAQSMKPQPFPSWRQAAGTGQLCMSSYSCPFALARARDHARAAACAVAERGQLVHGPAGVPAGSLSRAVIAWLKCFFR